MSPNFCLKWAPRLGGPESLAASCVQGLRPRVRRRTLPDAPSTASGSDRPASDVNLSHSLYSPNIMSPASNLHWFLTCILHLSNVPPSKLHLLFLFFLHLQFLPLFNLHFAFPFFLQLSCVPLSNLHFPIPFFCFFYFFNRDVNKHPRTNAIWQHKNASILPRPSSSVERSRIR